MGVEPGKAEKMVNRCKACSIRGIDLGVLINLGI